MPSWGFVHRRSRTPAALALVAVCAPPATATTLIRAGLQELTTANDTIVVGEVLESRSYWNDEGSFILTDVTVQVHEVLKASAVPKR